MRVVAALGVAGVAGLLQGAAPLPAEERAFSGADPAPLVDGRRVWIYPTEDGRRLHGWFSDDLEQWTRGPVLIRRDEVGWISRRDRRLLWAPHMTAARGRYYLYYSVGPQEPLASQIGVAVCTSPGGPCRDSGRPLIDGRDSDAAGRTAERRCSAANPPSGSGRFGFEAIDPMVFQDPISGRHLLYVGGSNGATLRLFELAADMVSVVRELPVEQPPCFTEGAWMHVHGGRYYLSYSSGRWDRSDYSVHYATSPTPQGPWQYRGVLLQSGDVAKGPGHHGFFRNTDGAWYVAFHRWMKQSGSGPFRRPPREVVVRRVSYDAAGNIEPIDPD